MAARAYCILSKSQQPPNAQSCIIFYDVPGAHQQTNFHHPQKKWIYAIDIHVHSLCVYISSLWVCILTYLLTFFSACHFLLARSFIHSLSILLRVCRNKKREANEIQCISDEWAPYIEHTYDAKKTSNEEAKEDFLNHQNKNKIIFIWLHVIQNVMYMTVGDYSSPAIRHSNVALCLLPTLPLAPDACVCVCVCARAWKERSNVLSNFCFANSIFFCTPCKRVPLDV